MPNIDRWSSNRIICITISMGDHLLPQNTKQEEDVPLLLTGGKRKEKDGAEHRNGKDKEGDFDLLIQLGPDIKEG